MAEIHGMANVGANARCHKALLAVVRSNLRQSAELRQSESGVRELVEQKASAE
jgi:hypothetical protein